MVVGRIAAIALLAFACRFKSGNFDEDRCLIATDCSPDEYCSELGLCALRACTGGDAECEQGASCGYDFRCDNNICVRETCTTDTDCTIPYGCDNGYCASVCTAFETEAGTRPEAGSVYNATVAVSPISNRDVTFMIAAANGTAVKPRDYDVATAFTIPAGAASINVPVMLVDNQFLEADKTFSLALVSPMPGVLGEPSVHAVTITNDDDKPGVLFDPDQGDASLDETNGNVNYNYRIILTSPSPTDVVVTFDTLGSTAVAGGNGDYQIQTPSVTIPAMQLFENVTLRINGDSVAEPDETVVMKLVLVSGTVVVSDVPRVHTIKNDD